MVTGELKYESSSKMIAKTLYIQIIMILTYKSFNIHFVSRYFITNAIPMIHKSDIAAELLSKEADN